MVTYRFKKGDLITDSSKRVVYLILDFENISDFNYSIYQVLQLTGSTLGTTRTIRIFDEFWTNVND